MKKNDRITFGFVILCVIGLAMAVSAGCGAKATEHKKDSPRSEIVNSAPADTIYFPDGYTNVSHKCDGPNMVYVAFHNDGAYASVAVVPNDPRCSK